MAHLGCRLKGAGSVAYPRTLLFPLSSGSCHLNHSDNTLAVRIKMKAVCRNFCILTHRLGLSADYRAILVFFTDPHAFTM